MRTESKVWVLVVFFVALFGFGMYSAFRPESYPLHFIRGEVRPLAQNVIIGPYPEKTEWKRLRNRMDIDVLVSLMDPSSKIEGGFVENEKAMAERYGMVFMNFPMDFVKLSDKSNIEQARRLVRYIQTSGGNRKFYVHCYLGRHRVKIFADAFSKAAGPAQREASAAKAGPRGPEAGLGTGADKSNKASH